MFKNSFIHIHGVGPKLERALWREGIADWLTALDAPLERIAHAKADAIKRGCEASLRALERGELGHFATAWPRPDVWRWLAEVQEQVGYLDIETDGQPKETGTITCAGLYDGQTPRMLIAGRDLGQLPDALAPYRMVVTYNGASFDLPFIRAKFPRIRLPPLHVDLCPTLRRVGLHGGLKSIERQVHLDRPEVVEEADGWTAVLLWRRHLAGDARALPTLTRYCAEDIVALQPLARLAYNRHLASLADAPPRVAPMERMARPRLDLPFSRELLAELTGVRLASAPLTLREKPEAWKTLTRPPVMESAHRQAVEWLKRKADERDGRRAG
ncbi:MAG: ribonuclease H-like domain-containing protein [Verrucomicrobiae bacterium]|nr:ribonuclease H-like domain-containing protein [Verrucomicrobiae bacterium]